MKKEHLREIKPEAMTLITLKQMESIDVEILEALTPEQIRDLGKDIKNKEESGKVFFEKHPELLDKLSKEAREELQGSFFKRHTAWIIVGVFSLTVVPLAFFLIRK